MPRDAHFLLASYPTNLLQGFAHQIPSNYDETEAAC